jgi:hypothetical protein
MPPNERYHDTKLSGKLGDLKDQDFVNMTEAFQLRLAVRGQ